MWVHEVPTSSVRVEFPEAVSVAALAVSLFGELLCIKMYPLDPHGRLDGRDNLRIH